jgi:ubiquinone/menaquinone biosynthesis C-methylase UbiE
MSEAQAFSVKRAEVEFHNFASLGEPERAMRVYAEENRRRGAIIAKHQEFIGGFTPFLEIGSNAGHTSYLLANEFVEAGGRNPEGFMLDISADSLRYGIALQEAWGYGKAPVRVAGDALNLPFRDGSLRFVMAHQMLSQFMGMEAVFREVSRVLMPGGVFLFSEEPLLRKLSLRLYRAPYYETMKPWERKLFDWGLLGYFVRDVIGAHQEESFGIRQNHTMGLKEWRELIDKYFVDAKYELFVPERGWGERAVKKLAIQLDPYKSVWRAARLLGGTMAASCRKAGQAEAVPLGQFETLLRCPDCKGDLRREADETLTCVQCGYSAALEGGVYNLLKSDDKRELYPGDRADIVDFSLPGHESKLIGDWYGLEGVFGNRYRWIGTEAHAKLTRVKQGPQRIRIRGFAMEQNLPVDLAVSVNGTTVGTWKQDRAGLFVLEADLPAAVQKADVLDVRISAGPAWKAPGDPRTLTVNLSMIRLIPVEAAGS